MSIPRVTYWALALFFLTGELSFVFAQRNFNGGGAGGGDFNPASMICCAGFSFIIPLCLAIWVFNDAANYGMNQFGWAALTFFFGLIGLVIYIVVRSNAGNQRSVRTRPRRPTRRYDDEDDYDDDYDRPRRRRPDDDDDRPRGGGRDRKKDDDIRRRDQWERDADY